jgi:hypothetical protein
MSKELATITSARTRDSKNRLAVTEMTDRELLEEIAINQRDTADLVAQFISDMAQNPMLKMFATKFGR